MNARKAVRNMKRIRYVLWLCILCMLFSGCRSTQYPLPETTLPTTDPTSPAPTLPGSRLELRNPDKLRISYTTNRSAVQYITSVSQLPNHEVFDKYDDAFFREHALLLVTETVSSGSAQVSIDSVFVDGGTATVLLARSMPGDAGTTDMATWLLWAEVDAGLDLRWIVANPSYGNSLDVHTH